MSDKTNSLMDLFSQLMTQPFFMGALKRNENMHRYSDLDKGRGRERLLKLLSKQDGLTNAEIVELLDIRPSSVSTMVKRLEDGGIVERQPLESDGRMSAIHLTEKGRKLLDSTNQNHNEISEIFFESLSEDEQQQLHDLLSKLLSEMPDVKKEMMKFMPHHGQFHRGRPFDFHDGMNGRNPFDRD